MVGIAVAVWTAVAWGGRVGLLAVGDDLFDILRIVGSVLIGFAAALVLVVPRFSVLRRTVLWVFVAWSVSIWARSIVVNWTEGGTLAFKLVHTVLAAGFFALAWLVFAYLRRSRDIAVT